MINAVFCKTQFSGPVSFSFTGHADSGVYGHDLICAAISAMCALTVNTLDEVFRIGGKIENNDGGFLSYTLPAGLNAERVRTASGIIAGLMLQTQDYSLQYPKNIVVKIKTIPDYFGI